MRSRVGIARHYQGWRGDARQSWCQLGLVQRVIQARIAIKQLGIDVGVKHHVGNGLRGGGQRRLVQEHRLQVSSLATILSCAFHKPLEVLLMSGAQVVVAQVVIPMPQAQGVDPVGVGSSGAQGDHCAAADPHQMCG